MLHIAICDDAPQELERAGSLLKKYACEHMHYEIKIQSFSAPLELLTHVAEKGSFDVLLLDIYMPALLVRSGAGTASQGDKCQIIFLTTSRDHA